MTGNHNARKRILHKTNSKRLKTCLNRTVENKTISEWYFFKHEIQNSSTYDDDNFVKLTSAEYDKYILIMIDKTHFNRL